MSDKHWQEVMKLAEEHGFIVQSYGGAAILATHANQKEHYGEEEYRRIQKMNGKEIPEGESND
jgi:hypothetical protein